MAMLKTTKLKRQKISQVKNLKDKMQRKCYVLQYFMENKATVPAERSQVL